MVNQLTLSGMVLSAMPVNEYDKRLVILTKERGKIVAFAKGARRPHSKYIAGSRPMAFGKFVLYEGKNAYNLVDISIDNYFEEIVTDIDSVYYGFYFLELAEYFTSENIEAKDNLNLLYVSLKALVNKRIPNELVRRIFELKMLALNGEYPNVFSCVKCGSKEKLSHFAIRNDGALCKECIGSDDSAIELNTSTFYTMQYIISAPLTKLYSFNVTEEVLTEFVMILRRFMKKHIDREFNSEELLGMEGIKG